MVDTGALVRFNKAVTRFVRDRDFAQTERKHQVPAGTIGIVVGEATGNWGNNTRRPVVFTSLGQRICELPENLEVLCQRP